MVRSLRWRLQLWHTALLSFVVACLGVLLYVQSRQTSLAKFDAELHAAARVLEGSLRGVPARQLRDGDEAPPDGGGDPNERRRRGGPAAEGGRPERDRPERDRPEGDRTERVLSLPDAFQNGSANEFPPYFAIWRENGTLYRKSRGAGELNGPPPPEMLPAGTDVAVRVRGTCREVLLVGPQGTRIVVGRDAAQELRELSRLAWQITLSGVGVLTMGAIGGWISSRRVLRPVAEMSRTADTISRSNLHRRLQVSDASGELHDLAVVLNRAFDRMHEAVETQARFTADASHELRTPLAVILAQAELALSRERTPEAYRDALGACQRAARRMQEVVTSLLALARLDAAQAIRQGGPSDLLQATSDVVEILGPLADERGVVIETSLPDVAEPMLVPGELSHLHTVATNLVANAIVHNRPGGKVWVSLMAAGQDVSLTVKDDGPGIAEDALPKIFQRFFRVDPARSRQMGSSGLGLAITLAIVEALGGRIDVESNPGAGSIFTVHVPRAETTA